MKIDLRRRRIRLSKKEKSGLFKALVFASVVGPVVSPKNTDKILSVTGGLAAVAGINVTGDEADGEKETEGAVEG